MTHSEAGKLGNIASRKGLQKYHRHKKLQYSINQNYCSFCKIALLYEQRNNKYCGQSCSARDRNFRRYGNITKKVKPRTVDHIVLNFCLNCNTKLRLRQQKYCNLTCQADYNWHQLKNKFISSGSFHAVGSAKRFLLERDGHQCVTCNNNEWQNLPIPLVLDHINGNADDWAITNCRLICCNCDAQTPTYKAKNKGNGRYSRRQRYKNGQSY